ncbi:MAG TPA: hypothetical protein VFH73_25055 [Polyangia bacterium]|nr:hypothetical protein [Polyangia bacterium]
MIAAVGVALAGGWSCSSTTYRDINYGTDVGVGFDAPQREASSDAPDTATGGSGGTAAGGTGGNTTGGTGGTGGSTGTGGTSGSGGATGTGGSAGSVGMDAAGDANDAPTQPDNG